MIFAGWSLAQLAVLFGVAGAGITGLYLLRMRRRQVTVPFAALWERLDRESDTRQLWRRLRRLVSWLIQLLLLALLCLALGDPRPSWWLEPPRSLAIVIDVSASMGGPTSTGGAGTRLDAARARAEAELAALGHRDRAIVIAAGPAPELVLPLSGQAGDDSTPGSASTLAELAGPALARLTPRPGRADLDAALALARSAVADAPDPALLVITDAALDAPGLAALEACVEGPLPCRVAPVEGPADNAAITAFAARRYPGDRQRVEVLAELWNLGPEPLPLVLDVLAEGVSVGRRELALAPGERRRELLPELDAARTRLQARLSAPSGDAPLRGIELDDAAWAVVPALDPVNVTLVSDGTNLFLEAALLALDDHVRLDAIGPDDPIAGSGGDPREILPDLVIFDLADRPLPDPLPATNLLIFDPHRLEDSPVEIAPRRALDRPRLTEQDRNHPILDGVVFKDVNLARGTAFVTEAGDQALVKHLGEPVVVLRERPEASTLVFGFDPRQSDLPLRVAFPLLIANAIDYFESRRPGFVATLPAGSARELSFVELGLGDAQDATLLRVDGPGGERRLRAQDGRFRFLADDVGLHELTLLDGASAGASVTLAVNMADVEASRLASRLDELDLPDAANAGPSPDPAPAREGPLWTLLLGLCLMISAAEWASYHRRRTV